MLRCTGLGDVERRDASCLLLESQTMPTVLQVGPYSFVFFSSDRGEPAHIHVKRDRQIAKFWLSPISLAINHGFKEHELNQITHLIVRHQSTLLEAWHDYFGS